MDDQHMCYNQGPQQVDKTLQQDVTPSLVKTFFTCEPGMHNQIHILSLRAILEFLRML